MPCPGSLFPWLNTLVERSHETGDSKDCDVASGFAISGTPRKSGTLPSSQTLLHPGPSVYRTRDREPFSSPDGPPETFVALSRDTLKSDSRWGAATTFTIVVISCAYIRFIGHFPSNMISMTKELNMGADHLSWLPITAKLRVCLTQNGDGWQAF